MVRPLLFFSFCLTLAAQTAEVGGVRVVQGRITQVRNGLVSLKTPNGGPGSSKGMHAHYVTAGPILQVDVSHAKVLLPDGQTTDAKPLEVGERVLVLYLPAANDAAPITASVVERLALADLVATH